MARIPLPQGDYTPHPAGQSVGHFYETEDLGMVETRFGVKPMIALKIQSDQHFLPDDHPTAGGEPFTVWMRVSLSNDPRSNLRKHREIILGRPLTPEEIQSPDFDPDFEFVGKKIQYTVVHNPGEGDKIYANVSNFMLSADQTGAPEPQAGPGVDVPAKKPAPKKPIDAPLPPFFDKMGEFVTEEVASWLQVVEGKTVGDNQEAIIRYRQKHLNTNAIDAALPEDVKTYALALMELTEEHWSTMDDLPF